MNERNLPVAEKRTEYVPVMYFRSRRVGDARLVHLRKVEGIRIGTAYNGDPVWSAYPDRATLCGIRNTEFCDKELKPTCRKCIRLRPEVPES